jgi:hypothetical protein
MRKFIAIAFAAALILGLAAANNANAQKTYTWTLVESAAVALHWPDGANSPNIFEAENGLLGRIIAETSASISNACELPPSSLCASGSPPAFLLPGGTAEGPVNLGGGNECNRKVIACNTLVIPGAGHGGHPAGNQDGIGEYSYLVLHTAGTPGGKGIGFFAGTFVQRSDPYTCNDCPPTGRGRDTNNQAGLQNTIIASKVTALSVSLWLTQSTAPFGHAQVSLASGGAGAGSVSVCGNGIAYQNLHTDLCVDGLQPGTGNFTIPDQKVITRVYSVTTSQHASFSNPGRCTPPDCYVEKVIIPAALAQNAAAKSVQVQSATTVLPPDAPGTLANGTVDSLLFSFTTQLLDMDGDGTEDRLDPCPNDGTDFCVIDLFGAGNCPAGQVFCVNAVGDLGCLDAALCNVRPDANQDCNIDGSDIVNVAGEGDGDSDGLESFGSGLPAGPFDP